MVGSWPPLASIRAICCRFAYFVLPIICPAALMEMKIRHAFDEVVERLRVVAALVIVEADGAGVLIAAPDGLLFDAAAANGGTHLQRRKADGDHEQHQAEDKKKGVAGFLAEVPRRSVRAIAG